jgi:zinc transporter ZupT
MSVSTPPSIGNSEIEKIKGQLREDGKFKNHMSWFYWIGALSFINSILAIVNSSFTFIFGLGITQLIDGIAIEVTKQLQTETKIIYVFSLVISLLFSGLFVLFGYLGNKKKKGAIITGVVLYALDAIFCLILGAYLDGAFHVWALVGLISGLVMLKGKKEDPTIPVIDPQKIGNDHYYDGMH